MPGWENVHKTFWAFYSLPLLDREDELLDLNAFPGDGLGRHYSKLPLLSLMWLTGETVQTRPAGKFNDDVPLLHSSHFGTNLWVILTWLGS